MDAMLTGAEVQDTASADQLASDLLRNHEFTKFLDGVVPMLLNFRLPPEAIASLVIGQTFVGNTHCGRQTIYCDGGHEVVLRERTPRAGPMSAKASTSRA